MLIVEGSDCVGKTSLCDVLLKRLCRLGCPVIPQHFGLLPKGWNYYDDYLPFMNTRTIMDRFIMSEVVYGHVIRKCSELTAEIYRRLDAHLRLQGSVTVVVTATDDWLQRQLEEKMKGRQEMFNEQQILAVNKGFCALVDPKADLSEIPDWVIGYDVDCDFIYEVSDTHPMPSSNMAFIDRVIAKFVERQEVVEWKGTY